MRCLLAVAAASALAIPAAADPGPTASPTPAPDGVTRRQGGDCARARELGKTCVLTIEPEKLTGERPTDEGIVITPVDWGLAGSLIRIRRDFIPEIVRAAEDL